ncbi:MAG: helix-turn-helix transcriptional regulator [Thermomicrobiales bacterium]|nr:helix-turn-helix transcriptional regulator [Thermomicrobiales bacterium]
MSTLADQAPASQPEELGKMLARFRNERGLAQKQAAELAGIDNSTLSRLESGGRGVSRETLDRLLDVLQLTRRQRLDVLVAAGFLTGEAAHLLADDDLSRLGRLLTGDAITPADARLLRDYLRLALAHARALGYDTD